MEHLNSTKSEEDSRFRGVLPPVRDLEVIIFHDHELTHAGGRVARQQFTGDMCDSRDLCVT